MPEVRDGAGLLDTSVLLAPAASAYLPAETSISALSLAELAAGPHASLDVAERGRRQERLQTIESVYDPLPFDARCARAYGGVYAAVLEAGRKARGPRVVDLMIAATAIAHELPLYTLNTKDLHGLEQLVEIVDCKSEE